MSASVQNAPDGGVIWRPSAGREQLQLRARLLAAVRQFFAERGLLEVETPLLTSATAPEPHLDPISCTLTRPDGTRETRYLPTSPEAAMKRLLAAGSGPIYQICRAFRNDERGPLHNPEFTMVEWYHPGWCYEQLMEETSLLLERLLACGPPRIMSYREAFTRFAAIDPWLAPPQELEAAAQRAANSPVEGDRDTLLDLLLVTKVEPGLRAEGGLVILKEFPATRAAMARIAPGNPPLALRFEVYYNGIELANGYQELTDPKEQRQRLEQANAQRSNPLPLDERFLAALEFGLPESAGVALGFDRVAMLAAGADLLDAVLAFPLERS